MATQTSQPNSGVWRVNGTSADLQTPQLSARIDLLNPQAGLAELVYHITRGHITQGDVTRGGTTRGDVSLPGFVLGITPGRKGPLSSDDLGEVFLRGNDLVVTYRETAQQPFSLQVYWRATAGNDGALILDTILSLQTDLLESFPGLAVETKLPATSVWQIATEREEARQIATAKGEQWCLPSDDSDGLLLQAAGGGWSYAEMTHPEDRGGGRLHHSEQDVYLLQRQLGGGFLEKGVIRRLRVRGVFLPQENDLKLAATCLASLATEIPPLTV